LSRLLAAGEPLTEAISTELVVAYLPKAQLNEEIRDAGELLSKDLFAFSQAVQIAQASTSAFGKTLDSATQELGGLQDADGMRTMVETISMATDQA